MNSEYVIVENHKQILGKKSSNNLFAVGVFGSLDNFSVFSVLNFLSLIRLAFSHFNLTDDLSSVIIISRFLSLIIFVFIFLLNLSVFKILSAFPMLQTILVKNIWLKISFRVVSLKSRNCIIFKSCFVHIFISAENSYKTESFTINKDAFLEIFYALVILGQSSQTWWLIWFFIYHPNIFELSTD